MSRPLFVNLRNSSPVSRNIEESPVHQITSTMAATMVNLFLPPPWTRMKQQERGTQRGPTPKARKAVFSQLLQGEPDNRSPMTVPDEMVWTIVLLRIPQQSCKSTGGTMTLRVSSGFIHSQFSRFEVSTKECLSKQLLTFSGKSQTRRFYTWIHGWQYSVIGLRN